jgi:hypothetical protein
MDIDTVVRVFELGISFVFLLVLCFNLFPSYRLDSFRQSVFVVRDELFDYAAAGNISFDDPAYKLLRKSMNGLIRYAHNLTFFRFCCTLVTLKLMGEEEEYDWAEKWRAALEQVPNDVRDKLIEFHARALYMALERMVTGSPVLLTSTVVLSVGGAAHQKWIGIRKLLETSASKIIDARIIEEEAARCA